MSARRPPSRAPRPAVFLDRDGTLVREVDFLVDPRELELLEGAAEAVARLNRAGLAVVLATNQSGIARGFLDEARLAELHALLERELALSGARLDAIEHCPHHPTEGAPPLRADCDCRKPRPGMLLRAARRLGLDLARSWIVGDAARDLEAGRAAGARALLVRTGKGAAELARLVAAGQRPEHVADLAEAVERILAATPARE